MSDNSELRKLQAIIDSQADRILDQAARIEELEAALHTILCNTEEDAIPHIGHHHMTAYQALAKDIADCASAALAPEQDK